MSLVRWDRRIRHLNAENERMHRRMWEDWKRFVSVWSWWDLVLYRWFGRVPAGWWWTRHP